MFGMDTIGREMSCGVSAADVMVMQSAEAADEIIEEIEYRFRIGDCNRNLTRICADLGYHLSELTPADQNRIVAIIHECER